MLRDPLLFGDYRNTLNEAEPRYYEDLLDYTAISFLFQEILAEYAERQSQAQPLSLVLFEDCLEHLTRVQRTLRMHRGHMLLIGVGGSGKHSITMLAAFTAQCELFEITLSRGYGEGQFRDDLKRLYERVGVEGKKVVFVMAAAQIVEEGFLELINNILTAGMVPALFTDEEKDAIVGAVRQKATEAGYSGAK